MSSARPAAGAVDVCVASLARHQLARDHGAVVLSVVGADDARLAWRRFLAGARRTEVVATTGDLDAVLAAWIAASNGVAVAAAARSAASAAAAVPAGSLSAHFAFRSERQRDEWIADWALTPALHLAAWLCQGAADGERRDAVDAPLPRTEVAASIAAWLGADAPAISVASRGDVATAARAAAAAAHALPTIPVALVATLDALARYLRDSAESSSKALVRQGLVGGEPAVADGADGGDDRRPAVLGRNPLTATLAAPATPASADDAAIHPALHRSGVATGGPATVRPQDRRPQAAVDADEPGRSAAERLLLAALDAEPRTRGQFALNAGIDAELGGHPVEIDLLAADAGVAVEVDGYFHFRDADAYRRDRRKDVVMQRHGLLVMRFLADDVVARTEAIVAAIADAVDDRRSPR